MINVSQKCQYALRALYELAKRGPSKPTTISDVAEAQAIPPRFLESILNQLKQSGYVESRRGPLGGYILSVSPADLTIGDVMRLMDGPFQPVKCVAGGGTECPMRGDCVFEDIWEEAAQTLNKVFDGTTFQDLVDKQRAKDPSSIAGRYI